MIRRRLAIVGLLSVLGVAPACASASRTYEVTACNSAPEAVNNSWTWGTTDASQPSHYAEHATCPYRSPGGTGGKTDQEGGLSTTDALGLATGAPPSTSASWTFTAPAGTTVAAINYERYLGHENDTSNSWSPALRADGNIVGGETCTVTFPNVGCLLGGPPGQGGEPGIVTGLAAHQLTFGVVCQAPSEQTCVTGATEHSVWAAMYGASVTVNDPTPPTLSAPSGALWEPGAHGGFHKGTEAVTTSAQDVGGGVQSITLSADGHPVATYSAPCNFTFPQPCPLSTGPQTLTLATPDLADGAHTLTLAATDAAGNESTVASEQIAIDNNPPPSPAALAASPTQPGGLTFTVTWTEPSGQVAPITEATYQVCPSTGSGACGPATAAPAGGPATVTVPGAGSWNIAVWLTDAAGNGTAANAAHTTVNVPAGGSGSPPGNSGPGTGPGTSTGPPTPKATIRVSETLHGRELVVHISGPASGRVRVTFTGRLGRRTVASCARTFVLKHGRLTAGFRLGPRTAAHATIRVSAQLDHEPAVTSTLRRRASKHR
jgi:Bacterial Ig-like domain